MKEVYWYENIRRKWNLNYFIVFFNRNGKFMEQIVTNFLESNKFYNESYIPTMVEVHFIMKELVFIVYLLWLISDIFREFHFVLETESSSTCKFRAFSNNPVHSRILSTSRVLSRFDVTSVIKSKWEITILNFVSTQSLYRLRAKYSVAWVQRHDEGQRFHYYSLYT